MIQLEPIQVVLLTMMIACLFLTLGMLIGRMIYKDLQVKLPTNRQQFHRSERPFKMVDAKEIIPTEKIITLPFFRYETFWKNDEVKYLESGNPFTINEKIRVEENGTTRYCIFVVKERKNDIYLLKKVAQVN